RAAARGFAVPKPLAVVDRLNLLLMERVRGASVKDLIEADDAPSSAERATRAAARALAALHSLPFASDERRSLATELNRLRKRAGWLALVAPLLAEQVTRLIGRLSARLAAAPDARICLIHADYKPSQLLVDGEHTALVDFDRTCLGDPAIDVGAFMAQCDKEALATGRDQLRQLADSFLDDYAS